MTQKVTSAATSIRHVPRLIRRIHWRRATRNLDLGGGKYDDATKWLRRRGVQNYVFDPYNRDAAHNMTVRELLKMSPADNCTIANVLNVLSGCVERNELLKQAAQLTQPGGLIFISVYERDRSGKGCFTTRGWQENRKLASYLEEVWLVFPFAHVGKKGIIVAENWT